MKGRRQKAIQCGSHILPRCALRIVLSGPETGCVSLALTHAETWRHAIVKSKLFNSITNFWKSKHHTLWHTRRFLNECHATYLCMMIPCQYSSIARRKQSRVDDIRHPCRISSVVPGLNTWLRAIWSDCLDSYKTDITPD